MRRECRECLPRPQRVSDPDMHQGTCGTHVPWCMPGALTSGLLWSRWRGKRSRHSRRMHSPQLYVSGKRHIIIFFVGHYITSPFVMPLRGYSLRLKVSPHGLRDRVLYDKVFSRSACCRRQVQRPLYHDRKYGIQNVRVHIENDMQPWDLSQPR